MAQTPESTLSARQFDSGLKNRALGRLEWLLLGLVLLAALANRLYYLGSFPDRVLADEADKAQDSIRILYGQPPQNGFFGLDWTSQPAFSAYKKAAFLAVFGINVTALRLSSAVLSTLALIPFYLLLRRPRIGGHPVFNPISVAAITLLILAAGYANVTPYIEWQQMSRTRQDRYLYLTAAEFPDWAQATITRARNKQASSNVGQWRDAHPIQDIANP